MRQNFLKMAPIKVTNKQKPVRKPPAPKKKPVRSASSRKVPRKSDACSDIAGTLTTALNRPMVVVVLALSVIFWLDHSTGKGFMHDFCKDKENAFCKWMNANFDKFAGMVVVTPALYDLPANVSTITAIVLYLGIFLLETRPVWVYALVALAVHTYFRARVTTTRYLIVGAALMIYLVSNSK
nr:TPA_asm: hypothetical protein 2 [Fasciohepa virus 2]